MRNSLPQWLVQLIQLAGSAIEVCSEADVLSPIKESDETVFDFPKTGIVVINRMRLDDPRKPFCDLVLQRESEAEQNQVRSQGSSQRKRSSISDCLLPLLNGEITTDSQWESFVSEAAADPSFSKKSAAAFQGWFICLEIEGLQAVDLNQLEEIRVMLETWTEPRGGLFSSASILRGSGLADLGRWGLFLPAGREDAETDQVQEVQNWVDLIQSELFMQARAGISAHCVELGTAFCCYEQSVFALIQGKRFRPNLRVYPYADMGIIHLLAELPKSSKQRYISQLLKGKAEDLTPELKDTIWTFVKNDLKLAETARELYLHRNSLNYRIERIREMLGMDIRTFEDAALMWVCLHLLQEQ